MEEAVDTAPLRAHVRLLGDILGNIIKENAGEALFNRVEQIRIQSKEAQDSDTWEALDQLLASLDDHEVLVIARAFSQFLNLANIADQQHTMSVRTESPFCQLGARENAPRVADRDQRPTHSGSDCQSSHRSGAHRAPDGDHSPHTHSQAPCVERLFVDIGQCHAGRSQQAADTASYR